MSNGFHIDSLQARITGLEEQVAEARKTWYDALPPLPIQEKCPICGCDWTDYGNLQRMEEGYTRWTNGSVRSGDPDDEAAPFVHWSTDGWDDMSESGNFEYVQCNGGCGACFQIPASEDWD